MRLSKNLWLQPDGMVFHTTTQMLMRLEDIPITCIYPESVGNFKLIRNKPDFPTNNGTKFVTVDYCSNIYKSKSGKSTFATFENFEYISNGWIKEHGIMKKLENNFTPLYAYIFFFEVNSEYFENLKLLKFKKL